MIADFCSLVKANREGDRTKKKDKHAGKAGKSDQLNRAKGSRGGLRPFFSAPCRVQGQRPCWGLGQRPNCWSSDLLQRKSQAWHLGRRQRSVPAHKLPLPQERNPPATQKINYENVHPKQSRGRTQTSSVLTALWSPPQRRNPLQHKNQLA